MTVEGRHLPTDYTAATLILLRGVCPDTVFPSSKEIERWERLILHPLSTRFHYCLNLNRSPKLSCKQPPAEIDYRRMTILTPSSGRADMSIMEIDYLGAFDWLIQDQQSRGCFKIQVRFQTSGLFCLSGQLASHPRIRCYRDSFGNISCYRSSLRHTEGSLNFQFVTISKTDAMFQTCLNR